MRLQEAEDAQARTATTGTPSHSALHLVPETMVLLWAKDAPNGNQHRGNAAASAFTNSSSGIDMIDDFMDGMYHPHDSKDDRKETGTIRPPSSNITSSTTTTTKTRTKPRTKMAAPAIPNCSGHQQPCKLCTVKKSGPNQGRKFYVCATASRIDQCPTFIWVDDTTKVRECGWSRILSSRTPTKQ